jgi:Flp pilus assembly protein TadD
MEETANHGRAGTAPNLRKRFAGALAILACILISACATSQNPRASGAISFDSFMRLGDDTRKAGDLVSAASFYERAHEMEPTRTEPLLRLGQVYTQAGLPKDAANAYESALKINDKDPAALRGLANLQLQSGDPAGAATNLRLALAQQPDWRSQNSLGVAEDMLGDRAAAQAAYRAGLGLSPGNLQLMNNLGLSLVLSGDFSQGLPILEQTAKDPSATPRMRLNLALAYGLAGEPDKAAQISKADLDAAKVQQNLGYYEFLRLLHNRDAIAAMLGAHQAETAQP